MRVMSIGWDKSKVDGAMHDIGRMYIHFHNNDSIPIRDFLKKHQEYAIYVWQFCHYIRPEFPLDIKIELRAFDNCLHMGIHTPPDYRDKAAEKVVYAASKAASSTADSDETWNRDTSLFVVDVF